MEQLIKLLPSVTLFEMMFTIGLGVTLAEIRAVAYDWKLVTRASIANYLLVPAAALGLLFLFEAKPLASAGFLIVAVCPGAPYAPPFTGIAKGNPLTAVGIMIVMAGSSALIAPLLLRWLLPLVEGDEDLQINAGRMVQALVLTQFLPMAIGLVIRSKKPALADRLQKPARVVSLVLNVALLSLIFIAQFRMLAEIRIVGYFGMLLLVFLMLLSGWLLGTPGGEGRKTLAINVGVRNVGVGLVIATASFPGTLAVTAATAYGLFQTIAVGLIAWAWGSFGASQGEAHKSSGDFGGAV